MNRKKEEPQEVVKNVIVKEEIKCNKDEEYERGSR